MRGQNATVERVKAYIDSAAVRSERRALEGSWFRNGAYLVGNQWILDDAEGFVPLDARKARSKHTANMILPKAMRATARLEGVNAEFRVLPEHDDRAARYAAKLGDLTMQHVMHATRFPDKRTTALLYAAMTGSGVFKVTWDPDVGDPERTYLDERENVPDFRPLMDPELRQAREAAGRFKDTRPGDINIDVVDPFCFNWDRQANDIDHCRFVWTEQAVPVDLIEERWNKKVAPDAASLNGAEQYRKMFRNMIPGIANVFSTATADQGDTARVLEWFQRPSKAHPRGLYVLIAGNEIVECGDNPYAVTGSPLPFAKLDWFPCPGRFWGLSLVDQIKDAQRARNEGRTYQRAWLRTHGHGVTWVPKGCGVTASKLDPKFGMILEYNSTTTGQPIIGQAPNMPPHVFQTTEVAEGEMNTIAGQSDPTNGKHAYPGQLRSGDAIRAVQSDANSILTPTSMSMLAATAEVGKQALQLVGRYWTKKRIVQVVGKSMDIETKYVTGSDLRRQYNVRVIVQPGALDTIEAREAKLMDVAMLPGFLDPSSPSDKAMLMKGLHFHSDSEWMRQTIQQEEGEEREIERMIDTPEYAPRAMPFNNAQIRAKVLERFLNSREFETIDPLAQKKVFQRWQEFTQVIQAQMEAQMEMAAKMQGTPGQKGVASQPRR
jgi:hypothetical protein